MSSFHNKFITWAEIEKRFDGQWVLLENPKTDKHLRILGGILRCHSKHRDVVYRRGIKLKPKHAAVLYVGKPKLMHYVLLAA